MEKGSDVELDPRGDEEEGHEDAEADRLELRVEEGVRHALVAVDELQGGSREEGAEDRFEPEARSEDDEHDHEQERAAHPDLGRGVLKTPQRRRDAHRPLETQDRQPDGDDEDHEGDQQHELASDPAAVPREEERKEDDRADLRDRRSGNYDLPEWGRCLAGVLQDRQDDAEAGR